MSQPGRDPTWSAQPGPVTVLDTKVGWTRLYANPQGIAYGGNSIALDQVEWVSYWATHTATKRFLWPQLTTANGTSWCAALVPRRAQGPVHFYEWAAATTSLRSGRSC